MKRKPYRPAMETLSKHFREITRAAFARHGFAQSEVVSNWADIVGPDLAAHSAPERIRWPRQAAETAQKTGGTLVVRAAPGRAIDLQYEGPRIIGRINSYFGYAAITQMKVIQGAMTPRPGPVQAVAANDSAFNNQYVDQLDDGPLKDALSRLGQSVAATRRSSPQGK